VGIPKAEFRFTPTFPHINETVTFNASASVANGGEIILYKWDFGTEDTAIYR